MKNQSVTLLEAAIPAQLTALLNTTALFTNVCFFILRPESDPGFTLFLRQWDPWDDISHTAPDFTAFGSNSCVLNSAGFKGGPIIQPICKEIELKKGILLYEHDVHLPQILAGCLNPHKQQWANPRGCLWHVWPGSSNSSGGLESPFPPVCESLAICKTKREAQTNSVAHRYCFHLLYSPPLQGCFPFVPSLLFPRSTPQQAPH